MRTLTMQVTLTFDHPIEEDDHDTLHERIRELMDQLYDEAGPNLTTIEDVDTVFEEARTPANC